MVSYHPARTRTGTSHISWSPPLPIPDSAQISPSVPTEDSPALGNCLGEDDVTAGGDGALQYLETLFPEGTTVDPEYLQGLFGTFDDVNFGQAIEPTIFDMPSELMGAVTCPLSTSLATESSGSSSVSGADDASSYMASYMDFFFYDDEFPVPPEQLPSYHQSS